MPKGARGCPVPLGASDSRVAATAGPPSPQPPSDPASAPTLEAPTSATAAPLGSCFPPEGALSSRRLLRWCLRWRR